MSVPYTIFYDESLLPGFIDRCWWTPCPAGFEIGPWREAAEEVAKLCGDPIPYHNEDLNRLLKEATRRLKR